MINHPVGLTWMYVGRLKSKQFEGARAPRDEQHRKGVYDLIISQSRIEEVRFLSIRAFVSGEPMPLRPARSRRETHACVPRRKPSDKAQTARFQYFGGLDGARLCALQGRRAGAAGAGTRTRRLLHLHL